MTTPQEVAEWMAQAVTEQGRLYQERAVRHIAEHFGEEFTYENESGNPAIAKPVLRAFRRLTEDTVVWERGDRSWHVRTDRDGAGRSSY